MKTSELIELLQKLPEDSVIALEIHNGHRFAESDFEVLVNEHFLNRYQADYMICAKEKEA